VVHFNTMQSLRIENATHCLVVRVDEDNLEVLVHAILVNPVRVEDAKVAAAATDALLRRAPQTALELEVVDTLADGLAVGCA
jgi:hypothetical protein